jgi:hypothetical protein
MPLKQGTGEGHPFGLVVGLTDPGMQLAHPGSKSFAQLSIRWSGVIRNGGGHQGNRDDDESYGIALLLLRSQMIADSLHPRPMSLPFQPETRSLTLQLLVAPCGQLSGDGQLCELMQERRRHLGSASGGLWYLPPALTDELTLPAAGPREALAIADPRAAVWLQLRFGGRLEQICLSSTWLHDKALEPPAPAPQANAA